MDVNACLNVLSIDAAIYASLACTAGLGVLLIWLLKQEDFPGRRYFAATIAAMVVWLLFGAAELATPDLSCKIAIASATWPAITLAPITWCLFIWCFCFDPGHRSARSFVALVGFLVIAISAIAISNPLHGLFYGPETRLTFEAGRLSAHFDHGPLFYVAAGVLYVFLLTALAIAAISSFRAARPTRPLMMALTFATAVPMGANLGYILLDATIFGFDPTPFAFAFILLALTPLLYSPRGFDIAAMARDLLYYNLPDPVIVVNDKGVVTGVNPASMARLPQIVPGRSLDACAPPPIVQQFEDCCNGDITQGEVVFANHTFLMNALPIPGQGHGEPVGAIGILTDVTQLKLQEERSRIIVDTVSDILWDYDFDSDTWWMSSDWPTKIGIALSVPQVGAQEWFKKVHPDDQAKLDRSFREILKSRDDNWEIDYRLFGDDGESIDVLVKAAVIRHPNGRIARMLGNVRNISAEKRQADGYTRAKALEALGRMTGGIAHDFNNLLLIIQGNAELLEWSGLGKEDAERVRLIAKASQSAADLTGRLLAFSGQRQLFVTRVNLHEFIADIAPLLKSAVTELVELEALVAPDTRDIAVDPNALEQAIINLAVNARDAQMQGGTIRIDCANYRVTGEQHPELEPGDYVRISVMDKGQGMAEDTIARAADPFFTTKDIGSGTGLGLSTVYGFTRHSGGSLQIESKIGQGTTVSLILPSASASCPRESRAASLAQPTSSKSCRILVVEDQPDVREHISTSLVKAGFDVSSAESAASALELLESGTTFDLLFTDVLMPGGMNGVQLMEAAQKIAPGMKVLLTSGFPAESLAGIGLARASELNLLTKPYKSAELISAITAVMEN